MAIPADYAAVQAALVPVIQSDFNTLVPPFAQGMIPYNEANVLAAQLAKVAVNALDVARAKRQQEA